MDISEVLDRGRAAAGSQADMARALGVSEPTVSRWYSGKGVPDYESCLRLARLTALPPRIVLEAAGRDASLLPPGDQGPHPVDPRRYVDLEDLDEHERWAVARLLAGKPHMRRFVRTNVQRPGHVAARPRRLAYAA